MREAVSLSANEARAQRNARHEGDEQRAAEREARDDGPRNAVAGHVGVDQHQRADHERDDAAEAEHAEGRQKRFGDEAAETEQHEREARIADGQQLHREQPDQQADRPGDTRQHEAGVREFEEQPVDADRQQDQRDVRIGDDRQEAAAPVGLDDDERRVRGRKPQRAGGRRDAAAVELPREIGRVLCDQVGDVLRARFVRRQADRLAHRALRPLGIASAQLREAAQIGGRVLRRLADLGRLRVGRQRSRRARCRRRARAARRRRLRRRGRRTAADAELHRRRRAEIGTGRHRRDMARIDDVGARARGTRAARRDEGRDRYRRAEDRLDDLPHRRVEAAGRIELQDRERRMLARGALERTDDEVGAGRPDRAVERNHDHGRRARRRKRGRGRRRRRGDGRAYDEQHREQRGARDPRGQRVTRAAAARGVRRSVTWSVHRDVRAARGRMPSGSRNGLGPTLKD
ncbi:hypothetical protein FEP75_05628 [Burkholderia multivorans]|nr:hypothetical protein [Burkholderia multivorans]